MGKVQLKPPVSTVRLYLSDQQLLPHLVTPPLNTHITAKEQPTGHFKFIINSLALKPNSLQVSVKEQRKQKDGPTPGCQASSATMCLDGPGLLGLWANLSLVREKSRKVTLETVTYNQSL